MKPSQTVAYLRVSSTTQKLDRQDSLRDDADRVFEEKASGGSRDRPVLNEMLAYVRDGDSVNVWSMDRLARSMVDLASIVQELVAKGVTITFKKENLTFSPDREDPYAMLTLHLIGAVAQFERSIIKQRQAEGIAKAKTKGVYKGRKKIELTPEQLDSARNQIAAGVPKAVVARGLGISRSVLYRELEERESTDIAA
jgi:DNA invertase Pin-like site-specific DNA recombinase